MPWSLAHHWNELTFALGHLCILGNNPIYASMMYKIYFPSVGFWHVIFASDQTDLLNLSIYMILRLSSKHFLQSPRKYRRNIPCDMLYLAGHDVYSTLKFPYPA